MANDLTLGNPTIIDRIRPVLRWEIILAAIPAILGYTASALCKMPKSSNIPFRPPAWVFGVVWPILYILLGIAWFRTAVTFGFVSFASGSYLLTSLLLTLWLVVYSCLRQTKNAVFVLLASVLSVAFNIALSDDPERLMLLPLIVWISFATLMNAWQTGVLQEDHKPGNANKTHPLPRPILTRDGKD